MLDAVEPAFSMLVFFHYLGCSKEWYGWSLGFLPLLYITYIMYSTVGRKDRMEARNVNFASLPTSSPGLVEKLARAVYDARHRRGRAQRIRHTKHDLGPMYDCARTQGQKSDWWTHGSGNPPKVRLYTLVNN